MTDELQTDSGDNGITLDQSEEVSNEEATTESGAELATATEDKQDKANDGAQKAINKQHAKFREEERKRIALEDEAAKLKEELEAFKAKDQIVIPELPDSWDENYDEVVKAREEAIRRQAVQEAQKNLATEQQNANMEAAKRADQERVNGLIESYDKQIGVLGLDPNEIKRAGDTVVDYGISSEVAEFILQQEDGPLITKYLADNPIELDDLRTMRPIDAALKINSTIKQAASALKPQASNAPDPADTLTGRGAGEMKHPLIKGATFE